MKTGQKTDKLHSDNSRRAEDTNKSAKTNWWRRAISWIWKKLSYFVGTIIVALIVAIIVKILGDFGWLEKIKTLLLRK
jgi:hypothetical protein